jgi:crotonobetainyl-CoA:carnitine CoA-transferase CaiB-like acyl-CoA transferase
LKLKGTPITVRHAPPALGEHTRQVLEQEFGFSAQQVDEWFALGVVA